MRHRLLAATVLLVLGSLARAADAPDVVNFDPKVGTMGTRVTIKSPIPPGAQLRLGTRVVGLLQEPGQHPSFAVPEGSASAFIEVLVQGKVVARSAVPFVVSGSSLVNQPKLIGLKEAIDVFGYAEPVPEGGVLPETRVKPIISLDDNQILTIGEAPPTGVQPAVTLGDAASAG
jgi:hypothetical protein